MQTRTPSRRAGYEGIQLRRGAYKGRPIQQYAVRINGADYAAGAPVTVAAGATGGAELTATYRTGGKHASGSTTVTAIP
ncbi:hypothetical protein ACFU8Q_26470 [Streptomyces sp. NPDC057543]|uniref:hypothetical protein n=1 Tax=Streptomyces sp. NPDC057543 TaxID=3346163 RepID=UPI0036CF6E96